ncbi:MAG: hypothetical protein BGO39_30560 [Chloroflexi bacterium 54-19]|nr:MAG: hypothetical protein BGO39_30560 [Chloroflexi bacterium 54-19]
MVKLDLHYVDPRLVALYDLENSSRADTDFYLNLATELEARRILDLGCGTGVLAREFAGPGREVTGIDPAPAMLSFARQQPGAEQVRWIEGDSTSLGKPDADLLVMTGNVAQVFLDDTGWEATLRDIHAALRPGGHLAFESRNPAVRAWEHWNRAETFEEFDSPNGPMESWLDIVRVEPGRVLMEGYNIFKDTGEVLKVSSELRFRSFDEITASLEKTGFTVERVYGDWTRGPFTEKSRVMVFVARSG